MHVNQMSHDKYVSFKQQLIKKAQSDSMSASFNVSITVDKTEYMLKIQPDKKCRMVVLQALKVECNEKGQFFELITNNILLSSLFEILLVQGIANNNQSKAIEAYSCRYCFICKANRI